MANVNIDVQLKVIGNGLAAVSKSTEELVKLQKEATSVGSSFKKIGETAAGVFAGGLLTKGFEAASNALSSFVGVISDSIGAASAQEDAVNRLNVALASSGNFSKQASQDLQAFANQLQATTKFEDDTILNTSALITALTGLSGKALQDATLATANLSAALGKDLESSATIVSKALEGDVAGLQKYGIEVKKGATDTETLTNVITSLNKQFGGAAEGQVKTFSGALTSLKNTFGDLLEEIGFTITKNPAVIAGFNAIKDAALNAGKFISDNSTEITLFVAKLVTFATTAATITAAVLDPIFRIVDATFQAIDGAVQIAISAFFALQQAASGNFGQAFQTLKASAIDAATGIKSAFVDDNIIGTIGVELAKVEQASKAGFASLASGAISAIEPVNALKDKVIELSAEQLLQAEQGRSLASAANESAAAQFAFQIEQEKIFLDQKIITQEEFFARQQEARQAQFDQELVQLNLALQNKDITEQQFAKSKLDRTKKLDQDVAKIDAARAKARDEQSRRDVQTASDVFGNLSSLSQTGNKTLFEIGKAAAVAQATIQASLAITKALAEGGPFLGPFLAASIAIKTGVEISKITSTKLATGITEVPNGFSNDTFPALLTSGERVVSANQNQDLKEFLSGNNNNQGVLEAILSKLDNLSNKTIVNVGGREIVNVLNDEIASGMVLRTT